MRRAADLIKKPIVQVDTGNIVGHVNDLLLDADQDRLVALITSPGGWLRDTTLIEWQCVVVSTGDVILVQPGAQPQSAKDVPQFKELLDSKIHVSGTAVMNTAGEKIGSVGELLIDDDGRIQGYAINRGFLGAEKQFVSANDVKALGSDALIIQSDSLRDHLEDLAEVDKPTTGRLMTPFGATVDVAEPPKSDQVDAGPAEAAEPLAATGETIVLDRSTAETMAEAPLVVPPAFDETPADSVTDEAADQPESQLSSAEVDAIVRGDAPMPDRDEGDRR